MTGASHRAVLGRLAQMGRLRSLVQTRGHDFTSNDYLALAESEALKEAAIITMSKSKFA